VPVRPRGAWHARRAHHCSGKARGLACTVREMGTAGLAVGRAANAGRDGSKSQPEPEPPTTLFRIQAQMASQKEAIVGVVELAAERPKRSRESIR
jgi:hypothetical protein